MKIGFLLNHDQVHQLWHSLPIAMELAQRDRFTDVVILTGSARLTAEVHRLLGDNHPRLTIIELGLRSAAGKAFKRCLDWLVPAGKFALYRDNLDVFRTFDFLVVTEKTSTILKTRYGLTNLKLIHTRHGAGDRAIGFDPASRRFDAVFVAGPVIRDRLIEEAGVEPHQITIVGYPKFDLIPDSTGPSIFGHDDRPTILYNPHVAPHLSSWRRHGLQVLEFFVRHPEYNLIFAPHVMLFHRPVTITIKPPRINFRGSIPKRIREAPNIHVDLSSRACTDMTYTRMADVYLGDVSSQTYEFMLNPRPCIFLNSHRQRDYATDLNFAHWAAGDVIEDISELGTALETALFLPERYSAVQRNLFRTHIELTDQKSSSRAAMSIEKLAFGTGPARSETPAQLVA